MLVVFPVIEIKIFRVIRGKLYNPIFRERRGAVVNIINADDE